MHISLCETSWKELFPLHDMCEPDEEYLTSYYHEIGYYDDSAVDLLDLALVALGDSEDLHRYEQRSVCAYTLRNEVDGKLIKTCCVLISSRYWRFVHI